MCAAEGERFRLREAVGEQLIVVTGEREVAFDEGDEVARNQHTPLVQHLEVGMLRVAAGAAPQHGGRVRADRLAVMTQRLAVRLHVELLQVVGKGTQRLAVGRDRKIPGAEEVDVPDAEQGHQQRNVLAGRRLPEMAVHRIGPVQHCVEGSHADGEGQGKSDGAPQGEASADPVPELEEVFRCDAEEYGLGRGCGHRDELLSHREIRRVAGRRKQPVACGAGIAEGFQRREGLAGNDEQRRARIEPLQTRGKIRRVEVRNVVDLQPRVGMGI